MSAEDWLTRLRAPVLKKHLAPGARTLEIGAFTRPMLRRPEYETHFLDFYSTEELREQVVKSNGDPTTVMPVDFVVKGEDYLSALTGKFDAVIANHVLEHIQNPIQWCVMISQAVKENGLLFISLPDKKRSFDKFRDETSIAHILCDYFVEGRDLGVEHCVETEIFYDREYAKRPRSLEESLSVDRLKNAMQRFHPGIHCHVFNGHTFLNKIMKPLIYMKLIPFSVVDYVAETPAGEFYTVLRKGEPVTDLTAEEFFASH